MAEITYVKVRVPATAANLGPGFDCLGMTLDIWNEVKFTLSGDSLEIQIHGEGENQLPRDKSNLIYYVLSETLLSHSKIIPKGLKIYCDNNIPVSSGLGSSASAVLAGILAAPDRRFGAFLFNRQRLLLAENRYPANQCDNLPPGFSIIHSGSENRFTRSLPKRGCDFQYQPEFPPDICFNK